MFNVIGRCTIDSNQVREQMPQIIYNENLTDNKQGYWPHLYTLLYENGYEDGGILKENSKVISYVYDLVFCKISTYKLTEAEIKEKIQNNFIKFFDSRYESVEKYGYALKCYYTDNLISIIGVSEDKDSLIVLPSEFVCVSEYKNYNAINGQERLALMGQTDTDAVKSTSIISANELTQNDVLNAKQEAEEQKRGLESEIEDVKNSASGELAQMQAQIDKLQKELEMKKQAQLNILNKKKKEMEKKLEQLELTIFRLDSEIYAIRCYTGEVVELKQLRKGNPASEDTPLVFYQKLRYLDEELGKYVSLYNADFSHISYFETLLQSRDDIVDLFAPSKRSLMIIKISKTGLGYRTLNDNMLDMYKKNHGQKIAIILRDGDNLYIAWTDDERIAFSGEAFFKPGETEITPEEKDIYEKGKYETEEAYEKRIKSEQRKNLDEFLSRYFISTIMQGLIDKNVIKFPERVKFENSPYIIKSYADGWLNTNQYGTFEDMINRCNNSIQKGDRILTVQSLRAQNPNHFYSAYCNDRGRGDKNRTHDVYAYDCTIYPINLVEHSAKYTFIEYAHGRFSVDKSKHEDCCERLTDAELREYKRKPYYADFEKTEETDTYQYFISLKKEWSYDKATANFEVFTHEFINLTFMNSVWLEYVIVNQKADGIRIGGEKVDYAYLLKYLKKAISFVREREERVSKHIAGIDKSILDDKEWPVKLSEWMLENNYHNFSEFRTKQFVRHLKEKNK